MLKFILVLLLCIGVNAINAYSWQQTGNTIRGKVVSPNGDDLSGATVLVKGTTTGTVTDLEGNFQINAARDAVLVVSYVSFQTIEVPVNNRSTINITLNEGQATLDEVVVVGYGTQKKSHLTGSIAKYSNENLEETPVARLDQALQGKIAGVQIQNTSSEAGAAPAVRVRGLSSINAGAAPLVVVDGHPVPDGLEFVNMADVESVEVLKDAASAAIYGSRGASGVILITTKSGKAEKPRYSIKSSMGVRSAYELYPMMTVTELADRMYNEASLRANDPSVSPVSPVNVMTTGDRAMYIIENTIMEGKPTNWQDEAMRRAMVQNLQLSVSGGKKEVKYFFSGGYQKDQGMIYHSEYDRFNLRSKIDAQLSEKVKLSFNINPSYIKRERPSVGYIDFIRFYSFLPAKHTDASAAWVSQRPQWAHIRPGDWAQARHFNGMVYTGTLPDGTEWSPTASTNPWSTSNNNPKSIMETRTIHSHDYRVLSSGDLSINILKGLDFKTTASVYASTSNAIDFAERNSSSDGQVSRGVYDNRTFIDLLSENILTYNKEVNNHSFSLLGGYTLQRTIVRNERVTGLDYPSDNIRTLNTALQIDMNNTFNNRNEIGLESYLGRLNYSFKNRYLLSASYRADGSSYFAPGNKWGAFPAVSLGWVASEEGFMKNINWLNHLKFRGSYGATGNNRIQDFAFVDLLFPANYSFGAGTGTIASGQVPSTNILANPDITWERTFQYNIGTDLAFLSNRLSLSLDVYQSKTDQLLLQQAAMGFTGVPLTWNNIGRLQNKGIELELTSHNISNSNFRWTTSANIAHNRNKLLELGGEAHQYNYGERNEVYVAQLNRPLIEFFGYKTDGVWLSQEHIDAAKEVDTGTNLANYFVPGGLKLADVNGDGKIDENDRTVIGSPYPDFTWGITNNFKIKAFDLSFMFQGVQGAQLINGDANYNESKKSNLKFVENRWISPMYPGDGKTPYLTNGFNWMLTDYVVEDASYYALREVVAGYTLPKRFANAVGMSSLRFYLSGQNLYFNMASGYRGINPEARSTSGLYGTALIDGYQRGGFPMPRTVMFGIDISL